jgi:hypothetical protein
VTSAFYLLQGFREKFTITMGLIYANFELQWLGSSTATAATGLGTATAAASCLDNNHYHHNHNLDNYNNHNNLDHDNHNHNLDNHNNNHNHNNLDNHNHNMDTTKASLGTTAATPTSCLGTTTATTASCLGSTPTTGKLPFLSTFCLFFLGDHSKGAVFVSRDFFKLPRCYCFLGTVPTKKENISDNRCFNSRCIALLRLFCIISWGGWIPNVTHVAKFRESMTFRQILY